MIRAIVFSCMGLGIALIVLMFRASSNNALFEEHYTWLVWVGFTLMAGLLALIGYQIHSLWRKLRGRVFGAKLALRLMAVFALMAVIPGGLVYTLSVQFLNRSIDSWFDVPMDKALESALSLGKGALEAAQNDLVRKSRDAAFRIAERPDEEADTLKQLRAQHGYEELSIYTAEGKAQAVMAGQRRLFADKPTAAELTEALRAPVKLTETMSDRALYLRVLVPIPAGATEGARLLQVIQAAPKKLASDAQSVETGIRDYQQLGLLRQGLKQLFELTLTLAMLLTLFSAISLSFLLSERLSAPLSALAESTRAIAKGDFSKLNPVKSRDEFGVLTQSFNTMTRQLAEASDVVARKQQELEHAKTYLESILGNLSSGVMTLDERLYVRTINQNAQDMLGFDQQASKGLKFPEWSATVPTLKPLIDEISAQIAASRDKPWERHIAYEGSAGRRTLQVRGTKLPATIDSGYVIVFDDITGLIQAQRDAAWGEVARRLAHEIKNPLTPIQLSAERLQMKLTDKLPPAEQEILARATNTIVAQVGALKGMVDDFSLYSRSSRLTPAELVLNDLVYEVLGLYESMNATMEIRLADDLPTQTADPALLRQVLHNLMQNALDALTGVTDPRILIVTAVHDQRVRLTVEDNGSGIHDDVMAHIFEPYVTTKPKGTGLGLAIVKKIVDEHHGTVSVVNVKPHGARVEIELPINFVAEGPFGGKAG
jgi:nitrogen fixation/metabolism regulation signal transduction histidine kinase